MRKFLAISFLILTSLTIQLNAKESKTEVRKPASRGQFVCIRSMNGKTLESRADAEKALNAYCDTRGGISVSKEGSYDELRGGGQSYVVCCVQK